MKIVLLGAPGAGKGTQAKLICDYFKILHISTGDIFREQIREMTPLGIKARKYIQNGDLVPDDLTISLIKVSLNEQQYSGGFLLDGFPRNLNQAKKLDLLLAEDKQYIDKVFLIDVPKNTILERIAGRRYCNECGTSYHIKFNPSKSIDRCEVCGEVLVHREDDKENIVLDRLEIYNKAIQPIISHYKQLGILEVIQGDVDAKDIFYSICSCFKTA